MAKKLVWNNGDADEIAASDFVGAVLHAGSTTLTSTTVSAKEALDVYVANSLSIDVDGVYDGGSNTDPDNTGLIGHVRAATPADTDQTVRTTAGTANADDIVAANVHGLDVISFGYAFDGTTWDRLRATSGALHVSDAGGSLTVDATQLDIDDLNATDDAVQAWTFDGTGNAIGSTGGSLDVNVTNTTITVSDAALANTAFATSQTDADDTEAAFPALSSRKYLSLYNMQAHTIYIGATGLDDTDGFPIEPGIYQTYRAGASLALYHVTKTGKTSRMAFLELA